MAGWPGGIKDVVRNHDILGGLDLMAENELTPGPARVGHYKAVFNLRGDDGQPTGRGSGGSSA